MSSTDRQLVICRNCGDQHYIEERKHRSASSFCPECRMRGGYVLDGNRKKTPTHECVYCGAEFTFIADHHREGHPSKRYDPVWYLDDFEEDKETIA